MNISSINFPDNIAGTKAPELTAALGKIFTVDAVVPGYDGTYNYVDVTYHINPDLTPRNIRIKASLIVSKLTYLAVNNLLPVDGMPVMTGRGWDLQ